MKRSLVFAGLVALAVLLVSLPAQAGWQEESLNGEAGLIGQVERELRLAHINRLRKGTPESLESSAAHLDILSSWKGIAAHCGSIAKTVLEEDV